jgi:hypothetical protein
LFIDEGITGPSSGKDDAYTKPALARMKRLNCILAIDNLIVSWRK